MGVILILGCWISTILYFFGRNVVVLYDVVLSMFTHVVPLVPTVLIVAGVALIVALVPKRPRLDVEQ